nr:uncharacterized protein LOC106678891 [Halyomorpha halys]
MKVERDVARRAAKTSGSQKDRVILRQKSDILKRRIITSKREVYRKLLENMDFRKDGTKAYKFLSRIDRDSTGANEPMIDGLKVLTRQDDIAKKFCKIFAQTSNFKPKHKIPRITWNKEAKSEINEPFSMSELTLALEDTKSGKAPGIDGIHPEFLKHIGSNAKRVILKFINLTWERGCIPDLWRKSQVIPIIKKSKSHNSFDSYRPVALTSAFCKVVEKMVLRRLMSAL